MQHSDNHSSREVGGVLVIVGTTLAAAAVVGALAAADHMATVSLCGPLVRHCLLCVASAASLLAASGVIAAGLALRHDPRPDQAVVARCGDPGRA
ncbi:MAG: hypothetical protein K0M78_08920 [Brevundimonas sp.]|nr:hypothetical protein [Brevundimonas sp.]